VLDSSRRPQQVALGSLLVGAVICLAKLVVGILTGSLGIISEAAHSGLDVVASAFALVAVRTARRPADAEHLYGHGRVENLAAYTEGILLTLTAGGIALEGIHRLLANSARVDASYYAMGLLVAAMLVEGVRAVVLRWAGRAAGSDALAADAQNRVADVLSSFGVLVGLVAVRLGYPWADSVAALLVAGLIGVTAIRILREAGDELMDRAPTGVEAGLRKAIGEVHGVREVRSVRVRRSGGRLLADARVSTRRTLSVEGAQTLTDQVQRAVSKELPDLDLLLAVEGQPEQANLVERVHATADRLGGFKDIEAIEKEAPRPAPELFERPTQGPKKLSYLEAREYAEIEERIIKAEQVLQRKRAELENPAIASDGAKLVAAHDEMEAAQKDLNALYARWAELEEKADTLPRRKP